MVPGTSFCPARGPECLYNWRILRSSQIIRCTVCKILSTVTFLYRLLPLLQNMWAVSKISFTQAGGRGKRSGSFSSVRTDPR